MDWADRTPWIERYSWFALDTDDYIWLGASRSCAGEACAMPLLLCAGPPSGGNSMRLAGPWH